ncbi:Nit protein-like protein 1, partial [Entophlyctis helioformis]
MLVAVAQLRSTPVVADNLATALQLVRAAAARGCKAIFLPEATDYIAANKEQGLALAQPLTGHFVTELRNAARSAGVYVSVGVHEQEAAACEPAGGSETPPGRFFNSHLLIDSQGELAAVYRKIHLFDVSITNGPILMESSTTIAGREFPKPVATPFGAVGLATCYDMRFPEQSTLLRRAGAQILTFPSAFTVKTGPAHWEPLLRARAIETQCYVIASAQSGLHTAHRASYGHAMIVDPWGTVVADCKTAEPCIEVADLDLGLVASVRRDMPVESHRRHDLY